MIGLSPIKNVHEVKRIYKEGKKFCCQNVKVASSSGWGNKDWPLGELYIYWLVTSRGIENPYSAAEIQNAEVYMSGGNIANIHLSW